MMYTMAAMSERGDGHYESRLLLLLCSVTILVHMGFRSKHQSGELPSDLGLVAPCGCLEGLTKSCSAILSLELATYDHIYLAVHNLTLNMVTKASN